MNWAIQGLYFPIFNAVSSTYKFCQWLDSNCRYLVVEVIALPTAPQPLPDQEALLLVRILYQGEIVAKKLLKFL